MKFKFNENELIELAKDLYLIELEAKGKDFFCNNTEYIPQRKKCKKICGACASWEQSKNL